MTPVAALNGALRRIPAWVVYVAGAAPLLWIVWLTVSDGLGVDPVKEIEHRLGKVALWFLMGGLAISPMRRFLGVNALRFRRAIGLTAFFYVLLHIAAWFVLDMGLLWGQALGDLWRRRYLLFGVAASAILLLLALTSNRASIRRLGKGWVWLHRGIYLAVIAAIIHYLMQMKVVTGWGWIWAGALAILLVARVIPRFRAGDVKLF